MSSGTRRPFSISSDRAAISGANSRKAVSKRAASLAGADAAAPSIRFRAIWALLVGKGTSLTRWRCAAPKIKAGTRRMLPDGGESRVIGYG
jgi:hypothetical protein